MKIYFLRGQISPVQRVILFPDKAKMPLSQEERYLPFYKIDSPFLGKFIRNPLFAVKHKNFCGISKITLYTKNFLVKDVLDSSVFSDGGWGVLSPQRANFSF